MLPEKSTLTRNCTEIWVVVLDKKQLRTPDKIGDSLLVPVVSSVFYLICQKGLLKMACGHALQRDSMKEVILWVYFVTLQVF